MLLAALFADLANNHDAMCTNVHVRNPAKRLYQRKGFRVDGQGNGPLGVLPRQVGQPCDGCDLPDQ